LIRATAAAAALLLASGCYTIRYERRSAADPGAPRDLMHHGFVGGLRGLEAKVDLAAICPSGVVSVESEITFLDALYTTATSHLLNLFHVPIWEPSTVSVVCARDGYTTAGTTRRIKIALVRLQPIGDVDPATCALLTEALAGALRKRTGISVLADSDLAALLGVEKTKEMLGCSDTGCIAEMAGALAVDRVVHGSIGRLGTSLLVNLSSLDPRKAVQIASVSERLVGGKEEAFLDALPRIVDHLIAEPKR
jgi:hypothetical protein